MNVQYSFLLATKMGDGTFLKREGGRIRPLKVNEPRYKQFGVTPDFPKTKNGRGVQ